MAEQNLTEQAKEGILKRIVEMSPKVGTASSLLDLAEAFALVTGQVSARGGKVTVTTK